MSERQDEEHIDFDDGNDPEGLIPTSPGHGGVAVFHAPQPMRGSRGGAASGQQVPTRPGADIDSPFLDLFGGVTPGQRTAGRPNGHRPTAPPPATAPSGTPVEKRLMREDERLFGTRATPVTSPPPATGTPPPAQTPTSPASAVPPARSAAGAPARPV